MTELPKTMKAWVVARNGAPKDALQLKTDWPAPAAPTGNNILVKISHAALNPADMHFMLVLPTWLPFRRSPIPGLDFAGEIVAAGPDVSPELQKVGTKVCGSLGVSQVAFGKGSLAEYVQVPAELVAVQPERMSSLEAAGVMGCAGQTAAIMIKEADVQPGQRVLINGASGGVGSVLLQIAKAKGATVYAVCSEANAEMVKRLGADEAIDYKAHDPIEVHLAEKFKDEHLDFIFDCAGSQPLFTHSPKYLKADGKFINIVGGRSQGIVPFVRNKLVPVFLGGTPRSYRLLGLSPAGNLAREVAKWVEEGLVTQAPIDSEFSMEEAVQAYEKLASKRAKGKIVVKIQG
ncbi:zinc alcohol dehydrogenase [Diplogelasinospora grovesii]|uniref:Zinc alcohol dehydrogenase n=1 Tax=Diplogelasinospora grovesii TaxID=303347 RepID=A0AAN6N0A5_9PEZI|nr:zinc alcohol dehydrogenase [Diplogelasinospora grovesii]